MAKARTRLGTKKKKKNKIFIKKSIQKQKIKIFNHLDS